MQDRYSSFLAKIESQLNFSVPDEEIRQEARALWEADGSPVGQDEKYWLRAEKNVWSRKRQEVARSILKKVIIPSAQDTAAVMQEEAQRFTKDAMKLFQKQLLENHQSMLPDGVRFHRRIGDIDYLILEEQPRVRTLFVDMAYHRGNFGTSRYREGEAEHSSCRVALPYVVYFIRLANYGQSMFHMFFRNQPLKKLDDKLFHSPLPNTHENGTVCCPWPSQNYTNMIDAVNGIIGFYWQSEFRYCLHHYFPGNPELKSWEAWIKATEENPLFVLGMNWRQMSQTAANWLQSVIAADTPSPALQQLGSRFVKEITEASVIKEPPKPVPVAKANMTDQEIQDLVKHDLDKCLENLRRG